MLSREKLKEALQQKPEWQVEVQPDRPYSAVVVAAEFEGVNDGQRQRQIWKVLLSKLEEDEIPQVGYVFTYSPSEYKGPPIADAVMAS